MIALNSKSKVHFDHLKHMNIEFTALAQTLSSIGGYYPNFKNWLYFSFRKEMIEGKRSIVLARDGNIIAGMSLLKHTIDERKICTFYVSPSYRGCGIGSQLMDQSTAYLGEKNINITVAEERNSELYPLLISKGFTIEQKISGYYRNAVDEYFYSLK